MSRSSSHIHFFSSRLSVRCPVRLCAKASCLCLLLAGGIPFPLNPSSASPQFFWGADGSGAVSSFGDSNSPVDGAQPDVTLESLDDQDKVSHSVGETIWGDDSRQTLTGALEAGGTQNFLVHIKNTGSATASFTLRLGGAPQNGDGKGARWPQAGWSARVTLDGEATNLVAPLQSQSGWQSAQISAGREAVLRVALTAPATVDGSTPLSSFRFTARCPNQSDAVVAQVGAQAIAKLRWNAEGDPDVETNWHDVTKDTRIEVEQFTVLGMRAVKANPAVDWPSPTGNGPVWTWQGQEVHGETVFLHADKVIGDIPNTAIVTCGNSQSVSVRVFKGDALLTFDLDEAH